MGFPSPAADYEEPSVTPNGACKWFDKPNQYLMRAAEGSWRAGIKKDAILVIDAARRPVEGSVVIADVGGQYCIKRLLLSPRPRLQSLDQPDVFTSIAESDMEGEATIFFGVVTHIINDATTEEFDDCPVM